MPMYSRPSNIMVSLRWALVFSSGLTDASTPSPSVAIVSQVSPCRNRPSQRGGQADMVSFPTRLVSSRIFIRLAGSTESLVYLSDG